MLKAIKHPGAKHPFDGFLQQDAELSSQLVESQLRP